LLLCCFFISEVNRGRTGGVSRYRFIPASDPVRIPHRYLNPSCVLIRLNENLSVQTEMHHALEEDVWLYLGWMFPNNTFLYQNIKLYFCYWSATLFTSNIKTRKYKNISMFKVHCLYWNRVQLGGKSICTFLGAILQLLIFI